MARLESYHNIARGLRGVVLSLLLALPAAGYDFEITTESVGQGYQLRRYAPEGVVVVARRRFTEALTLRIFELLPPPDPDSGKPTPRLEIVTAMRFGTDFGAYVDGTDAMGRDAVPELEDDALDLVFAYVEGRDLGPVAFRVGRQVVADVLDYYSFDGARVVLQAPAHLAVEATGGSEVKGASRLGSSTLELDGTGQSIRSDQSSALAPTVGGALETWGLRDLHGRVAYRRTWSRARIDDPATPDLDSDLELDGVEEEKVGASLDGRIGDAAQPYGAARYNLLTGRVDMIDGGTRVGLHPDHAVTAGYAYSVPDFAGDSIFNVYSIRPAQDASLRGDSRLGLGLRVYERYTLRRFADDVDAGGAGAVFSHVAGAGARLALRRGEIGTDLFYGDGYGGLYAGGSVAGRTLLLRERLLLEGRLLGARMANDVRDDLVRRDLLSLGVQAGARYVLVEGAAVHLLLEENRNDLYPSQLRVLAVLDLGYQP